MPAIEREEVRSIYAKKGFFGELLDRIVDTITKNDDVWVAVMMAEEHGLAETSWRASLRSSLVVGVSSLAGSLLPLAPFVVWRPPIATWVAVVVGAAVLFAVGAALHVPSAP